jgi:hypothetical protein
MLTVKSAQQSAKMCDCMNDQAVEDDKSVMPMVSDEVGDPAKTSGSETRM